MSTWSVCAVLSASQWTRPRSGSDCSVQADCATYQHATCIRLCVLYPYARSPTDERLGVCRERRSQYAMIEMLGSMLPPNPSLGGSLLSWGTARCAGRRDTGRLEEH